MKVRMVLLFWGMVPLCLELSALFWKDHGGKEGALILGYGTILSEEIQEDLEDSKEFT